MSASWLKLLRFIEITMVVLLMLSEFAIANETPPSEMEMGFVNGLSFQEEKISSKDSQIFLENIEQLERYNQKEKLTLGNELLQDLNFQRNTQTLENILKYPDQTQINNQKTNSSDHIHRSLPTITIRSLIFYEQYHYPVTLSSCQDYSISDMIDSTTGQFSSNSVFQERYLIYTAVTSVLGDTNIEITFKCVSSTTYLNTYGNQISGQFGSDTRTMYGSRYSYTSIPTIQVSKLYVYASVSPPSLNVLFSLGWFFFLGIFLAPIAAGFILLLLGRLSTTKIYGYQGLVFGMFRYINRQGDQQMFQWNHKILAFFLALFFFFHYALLLSNLTSSRITQIPSIHKDKYTDSRNYQYTITKQNHSTQYIIVDSYQYQFLAGQYTVYQKLNQVHESLNDQAYNLQLSRSEFTEAEIASINLAMIELRDSLAVSTINTPKNDKFNVHNNDIFFNGLILMAALILATLFKLLQIRFRALNSLTEISSYREFCNQEITNLISQMFNQQLTVSLSHVQASNYYEHAKKLKIPNQQRLVARQVFRIIQKRRKKSLKHKRKKINNQANNINNYNGPNTPNPLSNQQPQQDQPVPKTSTVYSVIKTFLQSERKGEITAIQTNPRNQERRKGIYQRAATSAFQNTEEETLELPQLPKQYIPMQNSLGMQDNKAGFSSPTKASIFGKRRASQLKKNNTSYDLPFPVTKELVSMEQSSSPFHQKKAQAATLSQYSPNKYHNSGVELQKQQSIPKNDIKDTSLSILDTGRQIESSQILSPTDILFTHPDFLQEPAKMLEEHNFKTNQNMTEGDEEIDSLMLEQPKQIQTSKFNPLNQVTEKNNVKGTFPVESSQNQKNGNIHGVKTHPVNFKKIIIKENDNFDFPTLSENQQENNGNTCINIIKNKNHDSNLNENEIFLKDSSVSSYRITGENSLHQISEGNHISNKISQKIQSIKDEESMSVGKEPPSIYIPSLQAQVHTLPVLVSHFMPKNIEKTKDIKDICDPHTTPTPESSDNHEISKQITPKDINNPEVGQNIHNTPARDKTKRANVQYSSETPDSKQMTNLTDEDSLRKNSENTGTS